MFKAETLLVIIFILASAIAVKASVFYGVGTDHKSGMIDPMGLP